MNLGIWVGEDNPAFDWDCCPFCPHNHKELEHLGYAFDDHRFAEDDDRWKGSSEIGSVQIASDQEDGPQRHPFGFLLPW